jgi:hypothetical protein
MDDETTMSMKLKCEEKGNDVHIVLAMSGRYVFLLLNV